MQTLEFIENMQEGEKVLIFTGRKITSAYILTNVEFIGGTVRELILCSVIILCLPAVVPDIVEYLYHVHVEEMPQ